MASRGGRKGQSNRNNRRLALLLTPATIFLGIFFLGPLGVMFFYSFLEPGLYGGVEWNFYHWNYGRILGWADGEWEDFDPVYAQIFLRSVRLALINVFITLLICYPAAFWVSRLPTRWQTFVVFMITLPFFVSLVSDRDHWLFASSTGGMTAGRVSPETALFPYITVDKIHECYTHTGGISLLRVYRGDACDAWEPFNLQQDGRYELTRNLYKNWLGNKLCYEEINHSLNLAIRYI